MKKYLSLLLVFAMLTACLAGCGSKEEAPATTTPSTETTTTTEPAVSNEPIELTVGVGAQFTTFDPFMNNEVVNGYVLTHLYANLFRTDPDYLPQKELCEDYTISEDGKVYTFTLKKDLKWSNGDPLTAYNFEYGWLRGLSFGADTAYTMTTMVNYVEGAKEYQAAALEKGTDFDCTKEDHSYVGIKAIDDLTFEVTLKNPCPHFLQLVAGSAWTALPLTAPQHEGLWAFEGGYPTSGPYTLQEANPNEKAVVVKNPNYWNAENVTLDKINFVVMTDSAAQFLAFQKGDIDVALSVSKDDCSKYAGTDSFWTVKTTTNYYLAINSGSTGPEWAKNVKVRKALALAIDPQAICDVIGADYYRPLHGLVPYGCADAEGDFRTNADADGYFIDYKPEEAKKLLEEAGYSASNPLHIVYKYSNNSVHQDVATMLQQQWAAIGVDVEFACVESGVFYDQLDAGDFEIGRYGYTSGVAIQQLQIWTTGNQIVAAVDDEYYNNLYEQTVATADTEEYFKGVHALENYLIDEMTYLIPIYTSTNAFLKNESFTGYTSNSSTPYFSFVEAK
ncbi:MAG: peptide ABC transporter substrate-binding protein [Firmicutes bacterium]|nr:peptide ABC transporter substrate-binding protein [Bacillota bacterium]